MAEDRMPHRLVLDERQSVTITGVTEVVRFEDTAVELHTSLGTLILQGQDMQLKELSLDGGQVAVEGQISAMLYEESGPARNWLGRLFG